ncbi:hypothetical protein SDC9_189053 [bioreactor metagenome]|uniref:Uncharacterized protein n=1 Tax=bioreactor metagenome TaxID=1076179 RepID=A0A645HR16_9ZZZZ
MHGCNSGIRIGIDPPQRLAGFQLFARSYKQVVNIAVERIVISVAHNHTRVVAGHGEHLRYFALKHRTDIGALLCLNINTVAVGGNVPLAVPPLPETSNNGCCPRNGHRQISTIGNKIPGKVERFIGCCGHFYFRLRLLYGRFDRFYSGFFPCRFFGLSSCFGLTARIGDGIGLPFSFGFRR